TRRSRIQLQKNGTASNSISRVSLGVISRKMPNPTGCQGVWFNAIIYTCPHLAQVKWRERIRQTMGFDGIMSYFWI
ncbi:hypothetical protein, partial [Acetobacter fallax]|uniref:hypothetical protein n=1 Tax=Acetobacter fallax TaxID=1737473 RepID=UPI001A7EA77F